jgi:O-methyltransferase
MSGSAAPPHSLVSGEVAAALCAKAAATPPGAFVEVGVYHGGTAWHLARLAETQGRRLYLYDTFTGIPYRCDRDSHAVGDFHDVDLTRVALDVGYGTFVPGIFPASALDMGPIAFVHLDCDQFQSYRDALEYFEPRMIEGGVIWCDDMPALQSAADAINEFVARGTCKLAMAEKAYLTFEGRRS